MTLVSKAIRRIPAQHKIKGNSNQGTACNNLLAIKFQHAVFAFGGVTVREMMTRLGQAVTRATSITTNISSITISFKHYLSQ